MVRYSGLRSERTIEDLEPDEFLEAIRINREFDKQESISLFAAADYHRITSKTYRKKSGDKIVTDQKTTNEAFKKARKLRASVTGENIEQKKGGMLASFMALTGQKINVIREIKTDDEWDKFIKEDS